MTPDLLEILVGMGAIIGFFGTVVVVTKMRFNHSLRMRKMPTGENERLTEAVEQLQDEVRLMRDEFVDLNERVDFTERMLAEGRARNVIGPRESTPV